MYLEPVSVVSPQNSFLFVGLKKGGGDRFNLAVLSNFIFKDTHCNFSSFGGHLLSMCPYLKSEHFKFGSKGDSL